MNYSPITSPDRPSSTLRRVFAVFAISLTLGLAGLFPVMVSTADTASSSLSVENKHRFIAQVIKSYMERRHYVKSTLDDVMSAQILNKYLETLDPERVYFLQQDISKFEELRHQFDDFIADSRLEPAFAIFLVYRARVGIQVDTALSMLDEGFDFAIDERFDVDRENARWASDQATLDELWRKRIKNDMIGLILSGKEKEDARETLRKRYQQLRHRTEQLNAGDVFQFYTNAYLLSVEPHTSYLSPRASENFRIRMSLSLEGIGAVLQSENEHTKVTRVVTGGPADLSGQLHAGDRIVGVGQGEEGEVTDVIGWRLDDVVDLIRGPKGSIVQLRVLPDKVGLTGETQIIAITRDKISLEEQAAKKSVQEVEHDGKAYKLGVITVPTFYADFEGRTQGDAEYRSTTKDVRELIRELDEEKIDALIVDLRGNGGGALSEAISLTGLFIEGGPIVQVRDSSGRTRVNSDPDPSISYTGPLAVMVDRNSASASEIFAGAIQDYRRGLIVGEPTFGKGTVQNLVSLDQHSNDDEDLGQLKLTVAQFFRVSGDSTQHRGVVPDILFPTATNSDSEGERSFDNALPWTRINPANYATDFAFRDNSIISELARRFDSRLGESDALQYLRDAQAFSASTRDIESVSLNIETRRKELEERRHAGVEIENRLRVSRGLPPVDEDAEPLEEEVSAETDETDEDSFPPDLQLEEAGVILAEFIGLMGGETRLAHTANESDTEARN